MAVIKDVLALSGASNSGQGLVAKRGFIVTDIGGTPELKIAIILALEGIPKLGEPHPTLSRLACTSQDISFIDSEKAQVSIGYEIPKFERGDLPAGSAGQLSEPGEAESGGASASPGASGTIEVSSTGSEIEVTTDRAGGEMIVSHNVLTEVAVVDEAGNPIIAAGSANILGTELKTISVEQKLTAQITVPQPILRIVRMQKGSPDQTARLFVGRVNSSFIGDDPPLSWMCTRIDGVSSDGGETYRVTFEFQYNSRLWLFTGDWIDPETDLPVPFADWNTPRDDNGQHGENKDFRIYDEIDFNILGIDFSKGLGVSQRSIAKSKSLGAIQRNNAKSSPDRLFN